MDDRLILSCWVISGTVFLGAIGALFGGLAGFMARLHGRTPGGFIGWRVLRAVEEKTRRFHGQYFARNSPSAADC